MILNKILTKIIFFLVLILNNNNVYSLGSKENNVPVLELIEEKSWFNDFAVIDDNVLIECKITIKNNTENNISFKLTAISNEDVRIGLLKKNILYGYTDDLSTDVFTISANETLEYIKVIFIGEFAGNHQKYDRMLPNNIIILLK